MKRWIIRLVAAGALAAGVTATAALAVTPTNGSDAGGSLVAINKGPADQFEPHVSGDFAVRTNNDGSAQTIHYFDFSSSDKTVPVGTFGDNDVLSAVACSKAASVLQASRFRSDVTVFRPNARPRPKLAPILHFDGIRRNACT